MYFRLCCLGSWVRGGGSPARPLFRGSAPVSGRGGGSARPFAQTPNVWNTQSASPFVQANRFSSPIGGGGGRSALSQVKYKPSFMVIFRIKHSIHVLFY